MPAKELASVPAIMASAFGKLNLERRARLLGRLLGSVGPLALVVVGGGVFANICETPDGPRSRYRSRTPLARRRARCRTSCAT
jgi:hypothetical protein